MTAHDLRDLRTGILINLYRVAPRGRSAAALQRILQTEIPCTVADVEAQLAFLGENVKAQPVSQIAPGLDPYWNITPAGMAFCEREKLV